MKDGRKAVWSIPYLSVAFLSKFKHNFIAYRSSKVLSRPDCIFEIHQLWQSGFSRVYCNSWWRSSFKPEIIKIGQSSHKMYSNNILNFQDSTTILNACTKKSGNLLKGPTYKQIYIYIYIYIYHHHHDVVPLAPISPTLSYHFFLSFIVSCRSSGLHPISSHSCWMYVRAGRPAFARPYVGVHRSTSLMSSSQLLQQCLACLVRLTWIAFVMGGRWPYSWCFVGCCPQDLFNIARNILVLLPSSFFSSCFVSVHVVHPYSSIDMTAALKKLRWGCLNIQGTHVTAYISIH